MLAYYVDAVRRAAEEKARLEGLVEAEARKPRWRKRVDSLRCLKGVDTASAADLVFEAGRVLEVQECPLVRGVGRPDALLLALL